MFRRISVYVFFEEKNIGASHHYPPSLGSEIRHIGDYVGDADDDDEDYEPGRRRRWLLYRGGPV
ncbi:hypothetical protein RP20_CCG013428 [Aedes albopictus]|nr:hypothetical protein RP20_CCG013428 [Aedes albopictus]